MAGISISDMTKIIISILALCFATLLIIGCASQQKPLAGTGNPVAIANPASIKCEQDGGADKILYGSDGSQYGLCLFPDGSVCDEWAYYRGECLKGTCFRTCQFIGSRSEGWYDCNNKLLFWDKCAGEDVKTAGTC
jgi:uncharacterized protein